jgi:hypothetical protein
MYLCVMGRIEFDLFCNIVFNLELFRQYVILFFPLCTRPDENHFKDKYLRPTNKIRMNIKQKNNKQTKTQTKRTYFTMQLSVETRC